MLLEPESVLAGYTVERVLGAGGMGMVYLARHPRMNRKVALKVLNASLAANPHARVAFETEAALAAELDHPNIVPVVDRSAPGDPVLWLAIRYIDSGDLSGLLDASPTGIVPQRAIRLITDAAHALDHAHRHNVLHRDVKPANLLLGHDVRQGEHTLLTDFGIARALDGIATGTGVSATLGYVAPERFSPRPTDHRADQYSLGCTLYQLLTGQLPFPGRDAPAMMQAHIHEPPPDPCAVRPELSAGLSSVIRRVLAKDPANRFPDCVSFAEAAAVAVEPKPTVVNQPPARELLREAGGTELRRRRDNHDVAPDSERPESGVVARALASPTHHAGAEPTDAEINRAIYRKAAGLYLAGVAVGVVATIVAEVLSGGSDLDSQDSTAAIPVWGVGISIAVLMMVAAAIGLFFDAYRLAQIGGDRGSIIGSIVGGVLASVVPGIVMCIGVDHGYYL